MTQDSGKSIAESDTKLTDPKVFLEAMMSEMRRVMKMEMEQIKRRFRPFNVDLILRHILSGRRRWSSC
jgi:hypothetical protein